MKPSDKLEKSKGVILFAFNTDTTDYIKIAENSARLIKKHLKLPVTVVTDKNISSEIFDTIVHQPAAIKNYRTGLNGGASWKNLDRYAAYDISPYDITCVMDSDVLVFDDSLLKYFDICEDYLLIDKQVFLSGSMPSAMGNYRIPQLWATIIWFKKTTTSKLYFDLVRRIQTNYDYYKNLYQIMQNNFRNDHAFTIAHNIISGYTIDQERLVPMTLHAVDDMIDDIEIQDTRIIIKLENKAHIYPLTIIHMLDKKFLESAKFTNKLVKYAQQ